MKLGLTSLTPSYAHAVFPRSCASPMLMGFFNANATALRERTESRGRSGEDGVDPVRRKTAGLATKLRDSGLKKRTKKLARKGLRNEAEVDSVNSLIIRGN